MMTSDTERIEREVMARWYADGAEVSLRRLIARVAAAEEGGKRMTNDEYDAQIRASLQPITARPETERAERLAAELDIDSYTRIDYAIGILETDQRRLSQQERRDLALLLRRWRKERFGSALTDAERRAGKAEINP